jgi:hypothetical protein
MSARRWLYPVLALFALALIPLLLGAIAASLTYSTLPSLDALTDYRPKIPLRIYSAEGVLLGEFMRSDAIWCARGRSRHYEGSHLRPRIDSIRMAARLHGRFARCLV